MSNINQRLDLRQAHNLVMTPQLQQAIKLLQMNNVELAEFIDSEIAQNPLLEKQGTESETDTPIQEQVKDAERDSLEDNFDGEWAGEDVKAAGSTSDFDAGTAQAGAGGAHNFDSIDEGFENSIQKQETLRDHLLEQLNVTFDDVRDRMIGALLIDMVDEAGYLRVEYDELAQKLGTDVSRIEKLMQTLRTFSPAGVFAKDLKDCLALQLEEQSKLDTMMVKLLDNLHLLAGHDMDALANKCDVNTAYLMDMIGDVKALNPKPASNFDHMVVQTAIPDVLMKKQPKHLGGGWRVELNTDTLPRVLINNEYYTMVNGAAKDKKDREYITTQMNNANWLVKSLDQRAQTILKVAAEIVERQDAFFNFGIEFLTPLTLKDIASVIDMHESTVSRVTTNKYIGTPRGIFELKYFFSTALVSSDGTAHSSESIKARIKSMVDGEKPDDVLSDDALVELLQKEGIDIARRTIAKYRDMLNIPSSVQRRKQKGR